MVDDYGPHDHDKDNPLGLHIHPEDKEEKMTKEEIDKDKNPIQANPINFENPNKSLDSENVPNDLEPTKKDLMDDIADMEKDINEAYEASEGEDDDKKKEPEKKEEKLKPISVKEYLSKSKEFKHQAGRRFKEADDIVIDADEVELDIKDEEEDKPKHKSADIAEADGGFVVSSWDTDDKIIANNFDEVISALKKIFGQTGEE